MALATASLIEVKDTARTYGDVTGSLVANLAGAK
jgi:hypothetical protein